MNFSHGDGIGRRTQKGFRFMILDKNGSEGSNPSRDFLMLRWWNWKTQQI